MFNIPDECRKTLKKQYAENNHVSLADKNCVRGYYTFIGEVYSRNH